MRRLLIATAVTVIAATAAPALATQVGAPVVCATTPTGKKAGCVTVAVDGDGVAQATVCAYDEFVAALPLMSTYAGSAVSCVYAGRSWGYLADAPAVCERQRGIDGDVACANGEGCLIWAMGMAWLRCGDEIRLTG